MARTRKDKQTAGGTGGAAARRAEVVVAGHICLDIIPSFPPTHTSFQQVLSPGKLVKIGPAVIGTGGAVSNTGLALHRLGVATRLMGKVGDDLFGRAILDVVRRHDPALAAGMIVTPNEPSSYTVVINPPGIDRMFLHCMGTNDTFTAADLAYDRLRGARLFHFGYPPLMRQMYADGGVELTTIYRRGKSAGLTTALDMAMPDPQSDAGRAPWPRLLERVLPHVDVFLPSLEETLFMLDRPRFTRLERQAGAAGLLSQVDGALLAELAQRLLAWGTAVVVLKLGDQGLYLRTTADPARLAALGRCAPAEPTLWRNRELLAPCFQANVVGTTGSGDCTIAGFLAGLLRGLPVAEVMTAAVAVGACNVEQADALSGIRPWVEVQERIRAGWRRHQVRLRLPGWQWDDQHQVWTGPNDRAG